MVMTRQQKIKNRAGTAEKNPPGAVENQRHRRRRQIDA